VHEFPGYKLEAGDDFEERLREEVLGAKVFLALITPASLKSQFAMFETGARWGARSNMTPIRACGAGDPDGPKNLSGLLAVRFITNGAELDEVLDVVGKIGSLLGMQASKPSVWNSDVAKFVKLAGRLLLKNETPESLSSAAKISETRRLS